MKNLLLKSMMLLSLLMVGMGAWADEWSYTFTANAWSGNGTQTLNGKSWTLNYDGGTISTFEAASGMHFGTNNNTCNFVTISSSAFAGTITSVKVESSRGSKLEGSLGVTVGSTAYSTSTGTTEALTTTSTEYTYTGEASGTISIKWTKTSGTGAFYVKKITVNYVNNAEKHTVVFNANGSKISQDEVAEGENITFPENPSAYFGYEFVGWVTSEIAGATDSKPELVSSMNMGTEDVNFYAVYALPKDNGETEETLTQTLEYDTWNYEGSTTNKSSYRLFGTNSKVYSEEFDLSTLSKVVVYGGTYGGDSYNKLTIGDGQTQTWKSVTVTGSSQTGKNTYTGGTAMRGTKSLYITSKSGNGSNNGVRISKIEIYTNEPVIGWCNYCTTVPTSTNVAVSTAGWATYYNAVAYTMPEGLEGYIMKDVDGTIKSVKAYEAGDAVPAETALLLKNEGDYTLNFTTGGDASKAEGNLLKGTLVEATTTGGNVYYKLAVGENGLGWYWGAEGGAAFTIGANKAYLALDAAVSAAKFISLFEETDGINNVNANASSNAIYNLAGQRVNANAKGIVIMNGKKYLNK